MTTPAAQEALKLDASPSTTTTQSNNIAASTQAGDGAAAQQPPTPSQQAATAQSNVGGDSLVCQWTSCGERCVTAEQLYDHVCERHVGRKSTNNLNLTCQWGNCRTTTVKRDHITSHIRVHVPLKPHKCDFCGKAFKRPQDLKKHVKTHADDSVLLRSPEPRSQHGGPGGYQGGAGKLVADLQALAATASGYYPDSGLGQNGGHPYPNPSANAAAAFYSSAPQSSAYGPVYYQVNQPANLSADYEIRKRAAYDALNEFFGDAKRRLIDPGTYYDVGARLAGLSNFGPPNVSGYHDYGSAGSMVASATHPPHHQYSLPLPALRTKSDLLGVDQFLDQLQTTVYESSNHLAAAGVAQAGAHYIHPQVGYRSSNSPPSSLPATSQAASSHAQAVASMTTPSNETPALTPASSVLSYTSGQSPGSVHSSATISPTTRSQMPSMYPTLPSVSAMSDMASAYPTTSSAPATGLGPSFSNDNRRRYSGGVLQRARQMSTEPMDTTEDISSPKSRHSSEPGTPRMHELSIQSPGPVLDPSLRSPSAQSHSSADETESQRWLENMRTIEMLRSYIKDRLEQEDYDSEHSDEEGGPSRSMKEEQTDEQSLYPVLKAVREGSP